MADLSQLGPLEFIIVEGDSLHYRYTIYLVPVGEDGQDCLRRDHITSASSMREARRDIRKERDRRGKYGEHGRIVHREAL